MPTWNYPDSSPHPHAFADLADCPFCTVRLQRLFWDQRKGTSHNQDYDDLLGFVCPSCGWWKAIRETGIWGPQNPRHMPKFAYQKFCQAGCLMRFSPNPPEPEVVRAANEVCSFLETRLTPGFVCSGQAAEQIAAPVLASHGHAVALASAVTLDMLAVLTREKERIGILFKPIGQTIAAWQLSALSGALVRSAKTRGVFASALTDDESAPPWGRPVELVNPLPFFAALNLAQIAQPTAQADFLAAHALDHMTRIQSGDTF